MSSSEGGDTLGPRSRLTKALAPGLFVTLLVGAPELLAGRPAWTVGAIAACGGAAAIAAAASMGRRAGCALNDTIPLLVCVLAVAWTMVQCVPMPIRMALWLDPRGVDDARRAAALLGHAAPGWWTISRSPWATVEQVVVGTAALTSFATAWWHTLARRHSLVAASVGASIVCVALVSIGHQLVGATSVFGVFTPRLMGRISGPLVNENHLSGFMAMGVPVLFVLGIEEKDRFRRFGWWAGGVLCTGLCIACVSRSGLGSLAVGLCVLAVLRLRVGRAQAAARAWAIAAGSLGFATVIAVFVALDDLGRDLGATNLDKARLALRGLDLVAQSPWTGVGRGAFSEAFVRLYGTTERVEQPENLLVQWASEWGIPVAAMLVVGLVPSWVRAAGTRSTLRMAALAGVASIVAHDQFDFAMERVGIAVVAAALLGLALAPSSSTHPAGVDGAPRSSRRVGRGYLLAMGLVAVAVAVLLGPGLNVRRARELEGVLVAELEAHNDRAFDETLVRAIELHPGEPTFPLLRAYAGIQRDDADVLAWLNRAMQLAPGWVSPHLLAARWLLDHGSLSQAWLEIRAAEMLLDESGRSLGCATIVRADALSEALRVFATQPAVLDRLATCPGLPTAVAMAIDDALLTSSLPGPRVRAAGRALTAGNPAHAVALLQPLVDAGDPDATLALADVFQRSGHPEESIRLLSDGRLEPAARGDAYRLLARAYADTSELTAMRETVAHLRGMAHGSSHDQARALLLLGSLEHQSGHDAQAQHAYEQANRMDPACGALVELARISEALGDRSRAYLAWAEACRADGPDSDACASAQRLRGDR